MRQVRYEDDLSTGRSCNNRIPNTERSAAIQLGVALLLLLLLLQEGAPVQVQHELLAGGVAAVGVLPDGAHHLRRDAEDDGSPPQQVALRGKAWLLLQMRR